MFGSVKKILGIEGVKIELVIPEMANKNTGILTGYIKCISLSDNNIIESINLVLIEKYTRGKKENLLVDEYVMGKLTLTEKINISKNDVVEVPFEMSFIYVESEMDKLGQQNFLTRGFVNLAKRLRNVKSEYYVKAEAIVRGTKLNPFDKKSVVLK